MGFAEHFGDSHFLRCSSVIQQVNKCAFNFYQPQRNGLLHCKIAFDRHLSTIFWIGNIKAQQRFSLCNHNNRNLHLVQSSNIYRIMITNMEFHCGLVEINCFKFPISIIVAYVFKDLKINSKLVSDTGIRLIILFNFFWWSYIKKTNLYIGILKIVRTNLLEFVQTHLLLNTFKNDFEIKFHRHFAEKYVTWKVDVFWRIWYISYL